MDTDKRAEFEQLFQEFARSYPSTSQGQWHANAYAVVRQQAHQNFDAVIAAANQSQDVTAQVLRTLLPYTNSPAHRQQGAWIHWAPAITGEIKTFFQRAGWTNPADWPQVAQAILQFVRRCTEDPTQLQAACTEFSGLPYTKGLQTGMLTPILNALRPEAFLLINGKSGQVVNYLAATSHSLNLVGYPAMNATARQLIAELTAVISLEGGPEINVADLFDMFCHWLVAIKQHPFRTPRYWKIAPGDHAWQWDECRDGGLIAMGWDELGDISGLSRPAFNTLRDERLANHPDWKKEGVEQVWKFAHAIREGDQVIANRGTQEVLGIGTVIGPYTFIPGVRHGHRRPVRWDDVTPRHVDEYGWRRTLIEIDRPKFEAILATPPGMPPDDHPFTTHTFGLLADLHDHPTREFYAAQRDAFRVAVESPFQALFRRIAAQLPPPLTAQLETERHLFGRILKNDWGSGGLGTTTGGLFIRRAASASKRPNYFCGSIESGSSGASPSGTTGVSSGSDFSATVTPIMPR